jgi:addiction module HigA family antidote
MSAGALAKVCGLPRTRIERIASEQTGITADTALRLAEALDTAPQLWLNLQNDYDVQIAKRDLGKWRCHDCGTHAYAALGRRVGIALTSSSRSAYKRDFAWNVVAWKVFGGDNALAACRSVGLARHGR